MAEGNTGGQSDIRMPLAVAYGGFALMLVCSPLTSTVEALVSLGLFSPGIGGWVDQTVFAIFFVGTLVVLGIRGRSTLDYLVHWYGLVGTLIAIEAGVVFIAIALNYQESRYFVDGALVASSILRGIGIGILLAAWMELFASLSPRVRFFGTSLTFALVFSALIALGLWALVNYAGDRATLGALALLPAVDVVLLRRSVSFQSHDKVARPLPKGRIDMPASTLLIIGSSGVSLGGIWVVIFSVSDASTALYPCMGFLVATVVLAVITRTVARSREYTFGMILRMETFISAAAFLLLPVLGPVQPAFALAAMGFAWAVGVYVFAFMPVQMMEKLPVRPLSVMASGAMAVGIGAVGMSILGGVLLAALGVTSHSLAIVTMLVCMVLLLAAMLMPPQAMDASALGIRSTMERETPVERLHRRCAEVTARHGLTDRESEVMLLMAQGLSRSRIAEELVVSNETVKTHAKHIYEKLGVHSLREMTTLIETGKIIDDTPAH